MFITINNFLVTWKLSETKGNCYGLESVSNNSADVLNLKIAFDLKSDLYPISKQQCKNTAHIVSGFSKGRLDN